MTLTPTFAPDIDPVTQVMLDEGLIKTCTTCKTTKPTTEFGKHTASRDGLKSECRVCIKARNAAYHAANLEKCRAYSVAYQAANPEKVKASKQAPTGKFASYKAGAKARNLPFSLSKEEFMSFWQQDCSYCGRPIPTIGLDRVDSSKGYEVGNVVSCCTACNTMKMDSSMEDWLTNMWMVLRHMGVTT